MKPTACVLLLIVSVSGTAGCVSKPTLKMFQIDAAPCYDRSVQAQTSIVDTHLHFRPFGGPAVPFEEVVSYLKKASVLFTYYLWHWSDASIIVVLHLLPGVPRHAGDTDAEE